MIKSVNTRLSYRNSSPASSRKRLQSSGTSSISSHDIPKTPVDAYSNLHPGKLGKDFSVLKMKKSLRLPRDDSDGFPKPAAPSREPSNPLPDWLANTFCGLEAGHPLRGLLSPSCVNTESKSDSPSVDLPGASREEELFAFLPFDKQEEAPDAAYRTDSALNVQRHVSSVASTEPTLSHLQLQTPTDALPFSTPGCFAPVRRSIERPIVDGTIPKSAVPAQQQMTSWTTHMMHPPALPLSHLHPDDVMEQAQFTHDISSPSDLQEHDANINHHQVFRGVHDNMNVYVTPGPTFSCSRPVYFDSPTEDPSLSDPLQPESYELDLNAIDFRWRPFLRSNAPESDMNKHPVSPSSPPGFTVPNRVTVGDQGGWNARFAADKREYGASSEELPSLAEDVDITDLDDAGAKLPSNVNAKFSTVSNTIGLSGWSSPINDVQEVMPALAPPGVFLSPLRDQSEPALLAVGRVLPRGDGEIIHTSEEPLVSERVPYLQARHIYDLWSPDVIPGSCMTKI
ncbi:hypothetical protein OG21DRAFT_1483350 [Imleria badia]|nr:hypothetical protein OG21DRAFT_1483350 [Imleria badia]